MPRKAKVQAVPRTIIGAVIDASGSMSIKTAETIQGYNSWLDEQQKLPDDAVIVVTKFNHTVEVIPAADVKGALPLDSTTYRPDGYTALYDAVMATIKAMEVVGKAGDRFLVLIITDGMENSSRQYKLAEVNNAILTRTKDGNWTFTYMGCEADAWQQAQSLGIQQGNFGNYHNSGGGTQVAFGTMSASTARYRSTSGGQSVGFYVEPDPDPVAALVTPKAKAKAKAKS